jgi:hypothetical protein
LLYEKAFALPTIQSLEAENKILKDLLYSAVEALREWSTDESSDLIEIDKQIKKHKINFNN